MLQASMDRWTQAVLGDDGIDMPYMGSRDNSRLELLQDLRNNMWNSGRRLYAPNLVSDIRVDGGK